MSAVHQLPRKSVQNVAGQNKPKESWRAFLQDETHKSPDVSQQRIEKTWKNAEFLVELMMSVYIENTHANKKHNY